ncbi:MAG: DUF2190 family protein [Phycisphaerales bacterium]|nr:DUF2190 family protein [Phycisphaerales bacterium]
MQAVFIQEGSSIDYTPGTDIGAGDVVINGDMVGIAKRDIPANTAGPLATEGVFDIAKANEALSFGDDVFWDADGDPVGGTAGSGAATATASGNTFLGRVIRAAVAGDQTVRVLVVRNRVPADQIALITIEDLAAAGDIAARPIFAHPGGAELVSAGILTQGAPAGVDDANTVVIALKDDAGNTIVTKTFDTANQPPSSDLGDLGALSATHKILVGDEHVTLDVTQGGTTSDMPAFVLVIRYRPAA